MNEYSDYNYLKLDHEMCVSYNTQLKEYSYDATLTGVPYDMLDWLKEHIGKFIYLEQYGLTKKNKLMLLGLH